MTRQNNSRQTSGSRRSSLFSWAFVLVVVGICLGVLQLALTPIDTPESHDDVDDVDHLRYNWVPPDMNAATRFLLGHSSAAATMQRLNNATLDMWKKLDGPAKLCGVRRRQTFSATGGMCFRETFIGYQARFLSTPLSLLHALEKLYGRTAVRNWTQPLDIHLHEWAPDMAVAERLTAISVDNGVSFRQYFEDLEKVMHAFLPRVSQLRLHIVGAAVPTAFHGEEWGFGRAGVGATSHFVVGGGGRAGPPPPPRSQNRWLMVRWEKALYAHFASRKAFVPPHLLLAQDWDIYDGSWSANADCVALNQELVTPDAVASALDNAHRMDRLHGRRHTRVAPGACLGADTLNVLTGTRFQRPWDVDRSDQLSASSSENVDHTSPPIPAVLTFRSEFEQLLARANLASLCANVVSEGSNPFADSFLEVEMDLEANEFWGSFVATRRGRQDTMITLSANSYLVVLNGTTAGRRGSSCVPTAKLPPLHDVPELKSAVLQQAFA